VPAALFESAGVGGGIARRAQQPSSQGGLAGNPPGLFGEGEENRLGHVLRRIGNEVYPKIVALPVEDASTVLYQFDIVFEQFSATSKSACPCHAPWHNKPSTPCCERDSRPASFATAIHHLFRFDSCERYRKAV